MSLSFKHKIDSYNEVAPLMLTSILGVLLLTLVNDLLILYLALELSSFAVYILAVSAKPTAFSLEAGMKYFVLGALSSGIILFGASLLYGLTGTIILSEIAVVISQAASHQEASVDIMFLYTVANIFILAGIAFKLGVAPFHAWVPDFYQGVPRHTVAFLIFVPKVAYMTLILRFTYIAIQTNAVYSFLLWVGIISLVIGSIGGISQNNILRIMGYSSIANLGIVCLVLGLGVPSAPGLAFFYFLIYILLNLAFIGLLITLIGYKGYLLTSLNDMSLLRREPYIAALIALNMFSNAGLPPFAGFHGKLYIGIELLRLEAFGLFLLIFVSSILSCYYYIRFIALIYFTKNENAPVSNNIPFFYKLLLSAFTFINVSFMLFAQYLSSVCETVVHLLV